MNSSTLHLLGGRLLPVLTLLGALTATVHAQQFHGAAVLKTPLFGTQPGVGSSTGRTGETVTALITVVNFDEFADSLILTNLVDVIHHSNGDETTPNLLGAGRTVTFSFGGAQQTITLTTNGITLPLLGDFVSVVHSYIARAGDENLPNGLLLDDAVARGIDLRNGAGGVPDSFTVGFPGQVMVTNDPPEVTNLCVLQAISDKWNDGNSRHAVWMPGIYTDFIFTPQFGSWFSNDNGTAQLIGIIRRRDDVSSGFNITVNLSGKTTIPGPDSPKLDLDPDAYVQNGGPIDPATWCYYEDFSGTFTGFGRYEGALMEIVRFGPAWQIGVGANGKNDNFGASAWFTWSVLQQPNSGSLPVAGQGDFNIDIIECVPATLGDFVWFDANQNGQQDGGQDEIGVMGTEVRLLACSSFTVLLTHVTDTSGSYLFTNLQAGSYRIQVIPPIGGAITPARNVGSDLTDSDVDPSTGLSGCVTLNNGLGAANLTVDVGLVPGFAPSPVPRLLSIEPLGGGNTLLSVQGRRFRNYLIEASENPGQGWEPLTTAWNVNGFLKFSDPAQPPSCFYRLKLLP